MKTKMKFLCALFFVVSLPFVLGSCSDDDDKVNNSIVGTWKFKEAAVGEIKTNSTADNAKLGALVAGWGKDDISQFTYTFAADGTLDWIDAYGTGTGTYTFKDGILTLIWGEDDYDAYGASIINGVLVLDVDYTDDCNDLELDELIELGIGNPTDFTVTKATAKVSFSRQ